VSNYLFVLFFNKFKLMNLDIIAWECWTAALDIWNFEFYNAGRSCVHKMVMVSFFVHPIPEEFSMRNLM
jgi:hypothetical protein